MKRILLGFGLILSMNLYSSADWPKNLHQACKNGDIEAVERLLQQDAKPWELDHEGETPVHKLFTNMGINKDAGRTINQHDHRTPESVIAIYNLLQSTSWTRNLMYINNRSGSTPKDRIIKELRYWCSDPADHSICKQYIELLEKLHYKNLI